MPRHQFESLFDNLEGAVLIAPAISALCPEWPLGINPHLDSIQEEFWTWVHHWFKEEKLRKKISKLNAPGFAAMNWPDAAKEQLLTMAKLIAWYFPWDDAIDDGSLYYKPNAVIQYHDDTIACVEQSLSWDAMTQTKPHANPAIQSFWDLGTEIRARGTPETNKQFQWAQCAFITSSIEGQMERELTEPVSIEQYLTRRERNIAVFPLLSLIYYNYQLEIPEEYSFKNNKHMNKMWRLLARMGIISNDMLSLWREIMHGQFESLVPLLMYHNNLQAQEAMDLAADMLHTCYNDFNVVELELYKEVPADLQPTMHRYVKACKDLIMCNLHWSYGLKRYMDEGMLQPDGRVIFPIKLPPKSPIVDDPSDRVGEKLTSATITNIEQPHKTTWAIATSNWPSFICQYVISIGLAAGIVFVTGAIPILLYPGST